MTSPAEDRSPHAHLDPVERDQQAPVADLVAQAALAEPEAADEERDATEGVEATDSPATHYAAAMSHDPQVGEYDALEQAHPVYLDEDAYR